MANHVDEHVGINGTQIRYRLEGREDAPAIVLAHSLGTDLQLWDAQVPALASQYRVLRYDARGHGHSDPPAGGVTIELLADDLLDLIDYCDIRRAHLVGISLGGLTVLAAAARSHAAVKSVTAASVRAVMSPASLQGFDERNQMLREGGLGPLTATMPPLWLAPRTVETRPDLTEKLRAMIAATSVEGFTACAEAVKTNTIAARLGAISVPTLFVAADEDSAIASEEVRDMQDRVTDSEFTLVLGAGHLPNIDQPDAFNAALLQFLGRVALP